MLNGEGETVGRDGRGLAARISEGWRATSEPPHPSLLTLLSARKIILVKMMEEKYKAM
jgi:hypothetical protein